ncbi:UDP-N-acetylenolpyruvoylglucosamine reductase [bacterium]|nr:UDP-N-acetylenolpyruvoylglucosamine reductase [bacterium]
MIKREIQMSKYTTFQTGGPAEYFTIVCNENELVEVSKFAHKEKLAITILGGGSNILVRDLGIEGLVIQNNITGMSVLREIGDSLVLQVGAGEDLDTLVQYAVSSDWWGLENLSSIPGKVGAVPIQNVGAYGVEASDVIQSVTAIHLNTFERRTFTNEECLFGYRDSFFKTKEGRVWCIVSVDFMLSKTPKPRLEYQDLANVFSSTSPSAAEVREAIIQIRQAKFPDWRIVGTAGSFFKNPIITNEHHKQLQSQYPQIPSYSVGEDAVKIPLGWILDKVCHLKGVSLGPVGTYAAQALVVVNHGSATTKDILSFAEHVSALVYEKTGIVIEKEVTVI